MQLWLFFYSAFYLAVLHKTEWKHEDGLVPYKRWDIISISQCLKWTWSFTGFTSHTTQKMKFSVTDFFSKCDQIGRFLPIWSHLLKKSLREIFIFCAVSKKPVSQFAEKNVPSYYLVLQLTKRLVNLRITYYSMQITWLVLVVILIKLLASWS